MRYWYVFVNFFTAKCQCFVCLSTLAELIKCDAATFSIAFFTELWLSVSVKLNMSTSFPSFCPKIANPPWFTSGEHKGDEIDVCFLETQYETWVSVAK